MSEHINSRRDVISRADGPQKLECIDCHFSIVGEFGAVFEQMQVHTKSQHGRALVFPREWYEKGEWTHAEVALNYSLLYPELAISA